MEYIITAIITVVFAVLIIVFYKFVINPQYIRTVASLSQCPDRWNYNQISHLCEPAYDTHCLAFDPTANTLTTMIAKCNLARGCGTFWSGMCG